MEQLCDELEAHAPSAVDGKVACVVAAQALAAMAGPSSPSARDRLNLLLEWVDDPTDRAFDDISSAAFDESRFMDSCTGFALRCATSSVGNDEAAWALRETCEAAFEAGLGWQQIEAIILASLTGRVLGPTAAQHDDED